MSLICSELHKLGFLKNYMDICVLCAVKKVQAK